MSAKQQRFLAAGPIGGWGITCHIGRQHWLTPGAHARWYPNFSFHFNWL